MTYGRAAKEGIAPIARGTVSERRGDADGFGAIPGTRSEKRSFVALLHAGLSSRVTATKPSVGTGPQPCSERKSSKISAS